MLVDAVSSADDDVDGWPRLAGAPVPLFSITLCRLGESSKSPAKAIENAFIWKQTIIIKIPFIASMRQPY